MTRRAALALPAPPALARRALFALTLAATASAPALAAGGEMSVAAFLVKADALRARGPMALFSSDIRLLQEEGRAAGMAYTAQLGAERAQGHPSSCPPKDVKIGADQVLAHLRTYPAEARPRVTMRTAIGDLFRKTWPCR